MLATGCTVDRYEVEAVLGSGGTAVVYLVRHRSLNTQHALKVLSVTSPSIRERMLREGRVQAAMRHLNLVAVTDVIEVNGSPGLLLEYIEGPSLEDALRQYKISVPNAELLFRGVVAGVRHAHQFGLVHRDLKPANVLLANSPQGFVPKVTDFGLAKVLQDEDGSTGQTRNGIAMGTPHYMAPEQIRDARNVDQRADLFSLGCILYELVTGRRAFPGDEALAIYNAVTGGEFLPPRRLRPDLPERFDLAIRGSMHVEPDLRIPDCDTLLKVLSGEQSWAVPEEQAEGEVPQLPPSLPTGSPILAVAERGPRGETPGPAPRRVSGPRPLDPLEEVPQRGAVYDTLGEESIETTQSGLPSYGVVLAAALAVGLILSVLGLGVVAGTALLVRTVPGPAEPEPTEVALGLDEAPEAPVTVDEPAEPSTEPATEPAAAASVATAPRPAPATTPAPITAPEPPPVAPAPPPAPAVHEVRLFTAPPTARVRIDGRDLLSTPLKVELEPGTYQVEVQLGDDVGRFPIRVRPGGENRWCFVFASEQALPGRCPR